MAADAERRASWTLGILLGGKSTRMGQDKALLDFGGRRLMDHVASEAGRGAERILFAVGTADRGRALGILPDNAVADPVGGAGPIAGFWALLSATRSPYLAVVACDMPDVRGKDLYALVFRLKESGAAVAHYRSEDGPESLPMAIAATALPRLIAFVERGGRKLLDLYQELGAVVLDRPAGPSADTCFRNLNTPEEYLSACPVRPPENGDGQSGHLIG